MPSVRGRPAPGTPRPSVDRPSPTPYDARVIAALAVLDRLAFAVSLPGDDVTLPDSDIELLERYAHIIYPALAVFVVLVLGVGIFRAWRTSELDVQQKIDLKRSILHKMREQVQGLTAEELAKDLGVDNFKTVGLLEEMQRDGQVVAHTTTARKTMWRIRGFG